MSAGGTRRPDSDSDEWADGGRRARPLYLTLRAPSARAPNGHQAGSRRPGIRRAERRSPAGSALGGARNRCAAPVMVAALILAGAVAVGARNRCAAPVMVAALILAGAVAVGATALLAWVLWRLASSGAGG